MKKIVALLVTFVMMSFALSLAEAPDYLGTWVCIDDRSSDSTTIVTFQLKDDHSVNYVYQLFFDDRPGMTEKGVYPWVEIDDQSFNILATNRVDPLSFTVLDHNHISGGIDMIYLRCGADPNEQYINQSPIGMWSVYWDARDLNDFLGSRRLSFDIQSYSLFLLDDGSAYMQKASKTESGSNFDPELISGIWIGDASDMTIRVSDKTYKAWIDKSGRLFLKMTDSMAYIFNRVPLYDYEEGFLQ